MNIKNILEKRKHLPPNLKPEINLSILRGSESSKGSKS